MTHSVLDVQVSIEEAKPCPLAVVRTPTEFSQVPRVIGETIDLVYAYLGSAPVRQDGHNVVVYRLRDDGVDIEVGVQVSGPFEASGRVEPSTQPAGPAAHAVYYGAYDGLPEMFAAVVAWCHEAGRPPVGVNWEVYGDWDDDPARRRTDVYVTIE